MTDGTGMILGKVGDGLCTGARSGIVFAYNPNNQLQASNAVRPANAEERHAYTEAMRKMLQDAAPYSIKAANILAQFRPEDFSILIPTGLDNIKTFRDVLNIVETYYLKLVPISAGMQVWLEQKIMGFNLSEQSVADLDALRDILASKIEHATDSLQTLRNDILLECERHPLSDRARKELTNRLNTLRPIYDLEDIVHPSQSDTHANKRSQSVKQKRDTANERLSSISGLTDYEISDAFHSILTYASQLNHDGQGCSGCRAQSCAGAGEKNDTGCPSGKAINTINELLKKMGPIHEKITEKQ